MSTTKKLSETLQDYEEFEGFNSAAANAPQLIDEARALEERVAELERQLREADTVNGELLMGGAVALAARAEAAEAKLARVRAMVAEGWSDDGKAPPFSFDQFQEITAIIDGTEGDK